MYTIGSISKAVPAYKTSLVHPEAEIQHLAYDSRRLANGDATLFFALRGVRDGHAFVADAYRQGVRNFVVSDPDFEVSDYGECNFIWVEDTLRALQRLAAYHRSRFDLKVIGITGSNGKTIVKEWLYQMLSVDYHCYQSPKSYNSQLGVALSLWDIQPEHQIALIEAGISQVGEMEHLEAMIRPDMGIFTSLGTAHAEGFASKEEKLAEKWKLFDRATQIVSPSTILCEPQRDERIVSWGTNTADTLKIVSVEHEHYHTAVHFVHAERPGQIDIPFTDLASIDNAMSCVATMLTLGYGWDVIQERISKLQALEMRLKLRQGKHNCSIVDDSYSNDLASLRIALEFLRQQNQHDRKSLIITDFVGAVWDDKLRDKVADLLRSVRFHRIILVGTNIGELATEVSGLISVYADTADFIASLSVHDFRDETILIKGARKFGLEQVVHLLVQKTHDTALEINLKAIEHNLVQYRAVLRPGVKLMAMVKAFSYGSGSFEVANVLQFNKVDYLAVAYVDEGVELRQGGINLPIMVMSPDESTFEDLVAHRLEPEVYSFGMLERFLAFLRRKQVTDYPVHIKLDTGMRRLGFVVTELAKLVALMRDSDRIKVKSLFSHFVGAGNPELRTFSDRQAREFAEAARHIERELGYSVIKHMCNSSAIVHRPQDQMDMVRLGIGLYGIELGADGLHLQEVGVLKTSITQIKSLREGETVGYDRQGVLGKDSRIATVKIGYADGYDRRFGNGVGKMLVNGHLVPTVGHICMDMCMLDISEVDAQEGDEVVVFPDISSAAASIGTIPYELLAGISSRVKRIYYYE